MTAIDNGVVMVTGAARGIGRAVAVAAGRQGYAVGVNYLRSETMANAVVAEIVEAGGRAVALQGDVGDAGEVNRIFDQMGEALGPATALVANAGETPARADFDSAPIETLERTVQVNLMGTIYCMRRTVADIRQSGSTGAIVVLSSEAARFGGNRISTYAASKAALNTLVIGTARELGQYGIRVNAVSPGAVMTDALSAEGQHRLVEMAKSVPLGRIGHPDEVAETVLWLLSDLASYVSGTVLTVSGAR